MGRSQQSLSELQIARRIKDGRGQGVGKKYTPWLYVQDVPSEGRSHRVYSHTTGRIIDYLVERLTTPLQIEQHLTMALMEGFVAGIKPITIDVLETTLSKRIDDIEPRLIRHGYSDKVLVEQFNYKLAEIRRFFKGELDVNRAKDITQDLREAGLPI